MKILTKNQGDDQWGSARCGVPSASNFHKIITPTGLPSSQASKYLRDLVEERATRQPKRLPDLPALERGVRVEPEARAWFEFMEGVTVQEVGFILHDSGQYGCSPDGLVDDVGLEIKCPYDKTHYKYFLAGVLPSKYIPQVQGSMLVTGLQAWWFMSYHPDWKSYKVLVERDDNYIKKLEQLLNEFCEELKESEL